MPRRGEKIPLEIRFLEKYQVDDNGCWIWTSATLGNAAGDLYPVIWIGDGKTDYAHRTSYRLFNGDIPDGYCVCHKCDTPLCVNPSHLFVGTHRDNSQDAVRKGRHAYGERNGGAKISLITASDIKELYQSGEGTHRGIAKKFGISKTQVGRIVRGESWK